MRPLERVAIGLAALALSVGVIAVLSGFFTSRDQGSLSGGSTGPGQRLPDQGDALLARGQLRPPYDSSPPTSGPHLRRAVTHDQSPLSDDQLLSALSLGDVVLMYGSRTVAARLRALAASLAGTFSPALAAAGQAVILSPRVGTQGVIGLAWTHMLRVSRPSDPRLREFAAFWLGRGAPAR